MWKLLLALVVAAVVWTQAISPRLARERVDLTGRWREVGGSSAVDFFSGGGVLVSDGMMEPGLAGTYRMDGDAVLVQLNPRAPAAAWPYELAGDELTLTISGRPHRFRRKL
jgi:hypothetical protein